MLLNKNFILLFSLCLARVKCQQEHQSTGSDRARSEKKDKGGGQKTTQKILSNQDVMGLVIEHGGGEDLELSGQNGTVINIRMGLLTSWMAALEDFSGPTSASAVSVAIEKIHSDITLGTKFRFSVITRDTSCTLGIAAGNTVRMFFDDRVDVIIGPACSASAKPAAQLASFWNIPIVSWVAADPTFADKKIYTTFVRSFGPFDQLGFAIKDLFDFYGWNRIAMISSNWLLWDDAARAIELVLNDNNFTLPVHVELDDNEITIENIDKALEKMKKTARIIMVILPKEARRQFLLKAFDKGMTNGDYVYYTLEMIPDDDIIEASETWWAPDNRNDDARRAFESVFHVSLAALSGGQVNQFRVEVASRMRKVPWKIYMPDDTVENSIGDKFSPYLHDAVILYALALNKTLSQGKDYRNGTAIAENARNYYFKGMTGNVAMNNQADRLSNYWITDMTPDGVFTRIAELTNSEGGQRLHKDPRQVQKATEESRRVFRFTGEPRWPSGLVGHIHAPPDVPVCGFENEFCPEVTATLYIILGVIFSSIFLTGFVILVCWLYRRSRYEAQLMSMAWKINYEDIERLATGSKHGSSKKKDGSRGSVASSGKNSGGGLAAGSSKESGSQTKSNPTTGTGTQVFAKAGYYKGMMVAIKDINKEHMNVSRTVMREFYDLRDILHENLNVFVGACIEPPNICLLWAYCHKGSLQDIIENDDIKLDTTFRLSMLSDVARGMEYMHKSVLHAHGNLKSTNCLVDNRWTVKITDYGLHSFLTGRGQKKEEDENYEFLRKQWTAPEILRENFPNAVGSQKGDVYSFAIISYEVCGRQAPYNFDNITPRDCINRVRNGEAKPFRPTIPDDGFEVGPKMTQIIQNCWNENPDARPTFSIIRKNLRDMTGGEIVIVDMILSMMEKYSNNLEEIIEERTQQLNEEKIKTDKLLYRMLPPTVADNLKLGRPVHPEAYDSVTIYFSDVVGFTHLAGESSPLQIVDFLNDLYTCFDDIIAKHDVYKVETIGDAYMVASGVPQRNGQRHTEEIANCALDLLSASTHFRIRHRPQMQLQLRIGLHTGPVVAGVVGLIMPRYCLFGDTVNTAARMESNGKESRIHLSKQLQIALKEKDVFEMKQRGEMNVKGKGLQMTYWLYGKKGYDKPLPKFVDDAALDEFSYSQDGAKDGVDKKETA